MLTQALLIAAGAARVALAQSDDFVPLASKRFDFDNLPYQADTDDGERGRQVGYNRCNSTTAGPDSLCQTAIINSLDDFCLWGPPELGEPVGNIEGEMVAWCTQGEKHGARQFPPGALTGVQFIQTPNYVQITGRINQEMMNILPGDDGGEMDPHGADQRGNPLGGLLYSNSFGDGYQQVLQWHNFQGANMFCLKACDPSWEDGYRMCEHIFDRIGCNANAPAAYEEGVYESCLGDNQQYPGYYVVDGVTSTYSQPHTGVIGTLPYVPIIPATSSCTPYQSADIYNQPFSAGATTSARSSSATSLASSSASANASSSAISSSSANATSSAVSSASASASNSTSSLASATSSGVSAASSAVSSLTGAGNSLVASVTSDVADAASAAAGSPTSGAGKLAPAGGLLALLGFVAMA